MDGACGREREGWARQGDPDGAGAGAAGDVLAGLERRVVEAPAGGDIEGPLVRLMARIHDAHVAAHGKGAAATGGAAA